ncbi:MAG: hypothetical protein EAZ95_01090 [Bacteroidetes bacterium]|nr:MAG: hypothetical protein EAZ95_01090 [Bacteroidota bacterium]
MRSIFTLFLMFVLPATVLAQDPSAVWRSLADVSYEPRVIDGQKMEYPIFGREAKKLNGQTVTVRGYYLPLDVKGTNTFMFSSLPMSSCYFCGGAGPETVMEVVSKSKIFYNKKPITLRGRLKLNADDNEHMMYVLENAERIDE